MSKWLTRALASSGSLPPVPILSKSTKLAETSYFGDFDNFGTRFPTTKYPSAHPIAVSEPLSPVPISPKSPKWLETGDFGDFDNFGTGVPVFRETTLTARSIAASPCAGWAQGLARLSPDVAPCPGLRRWPEIYARARRFLDQHGERAAELGWSTLDLWSVHPIYGTFRVDHCGALTLYAGGDVREVLPDEIRFARTTFRRVPGAQMGIPIWSFGQEPSQ